MQPLIGSVRANLSETAVRALLQSRSTIKITYGAEALDASFGVVGDISKYMTTGSSIVSSIGRPIQRTCNLNIEADVTSSGWSYLSGFIRPYQVFTDVASGLSAQFNLGVYTLTTPKNAVGVTPALLNFQGYDLNYLLNQPIPDSYEVAAGQEPAEAAAAVIGLAIPDVSVQVVASGSTLPTQMSWPFNPAQPVTYMKIVTDLLATVGYRQPWVDWDGTYRVEPFVDLQQEPFEWTFNTGDVANILAENRDQNIDLFNVPNSFQFTMANLTASPALGVNMFQWIDTSSANPGSTVNRGRALWHIEEVACATYDDLVAYAQKTILNLLRPSETFDVTMQPFPLFWHLDVLQYLDNGLLQALPFTQDNERRVCVTDWSLPLDGQSEMTLTWQTLSDQDASLGLTTSTL